jgi:hypothetical protein
MIQQYIPYIIFMYAYQARGRFFMWKSCILDSVIKNVMSLVLRQRQMVAEKVLFSHINCKHKMLFMGCDTVKAKCKSKFGTAYAI